MDGDGRATTAVRATLGIVVVLAVWLGAVLFFIAVVAPAAFSALPTRTLAGALVGHPLPTIFYAGIVAGVAAFLMTLAGGAATGRRRLQLAGDGAIAVLCFLGQVVIGGRIARMMASLHAPLDALPPGDPARATFGRLHALSVASLGLAALVALAVLGMALSSAARQRSVGD
jgi:hypothetical protein